MRKKIAALGLFALLAGRPLSGQRFQPRQLVERTIENQHRDDAALYDYERIEHRISYEDGVVASDRTYRVVPTGTGRLSLLLKNGDQPVSASQYRKELRWWRDVLRHAVDPNDPREQYSEQVRRERDSKRAKLIDAIGRAFRFTWMGDEVAGGRTLAHIALDPNPDFQPDSRETEVLRHVRAEVWIDVRAAQLVRGRAEITSPISVAGGVVSRINPGGWFEIGQHEVAPGVWLPERTEYEFRQRLFLFSSKVHKLVETSGYRYVGTPQQALEMVERELRSGLPFSPGS
jgi:hypothetical protein